MAVSCERSCVAAILSESGVVCDSFVFFCGGSCLRVFLSKGYTSTVIHFLIQLRIRTFAGFSDTCVAV